MICQNRTGGEFLPAASWTICISNGKYSSATLCSLGVWKWNCFRLNFVPPRVVVPLTMTSTVVPKFSNSAASTSGITTLGASAASWTVLSIFIGDCTFEVAQAEFSAESPAQFRGPWSPVYPNFETSTVAAPAARGNRLVPYIQFAEERKGAESAAAMKTNCCVYIFAEDCRAGCWDLKRRSTKGEIENWKKDKCLLSVERTG